jgi:hypothetical protein
VTKEEEKTKVPALKQQPKPLSNHKQTLDVDELPDSVLGQRRHQESATKKHPIYSVYLKIFANHL